MSYTMKIILATDFHLSYRQYGLIEREKDFYNKFNKLVEEVIKEKPLIFIELGDIFHTPQPKPIAIQTFKEGIQKLKKEGIKCYGIIGNHTKLRLQNYYPIDLIFNDLEILEGEYITIDDVFIGGIGYVSPYDDLKARIDKLYEEAEPYKVKVLLLHQSLKNDIPLGYDFDEDELGLNRYDFVFLGHLHNRILRNGNGTVIHYVGSLNSCNRTELLEEQNTGKGYTVFDTDTLELTMKNIPSEREYFQINMKTDELKNINVSELLPEYEENRKPLLHLRIIGEQSMNIYEKIQELNKHTLRTDYEIIQEKNDEDKKIQIINNQNTIKDLINEYFKDEESKGVFAYELFKLLKDNKIDEAKELADKELEKDDD